jgi:beta-glucosidase
MTAAGGEDRYAFYVDGRKVIEQPRAEGQAPLSVELPLQAGRTITVRLDYRPDSDHFRAGFGIRAGDDLVSSAARAAAAAADVALVCVGFDPTTEREGYDRSFPLPWGQADLIRAVAAANPSTVVALTAGGGVDMRDWLPQVPALIDTWYPGQEGGQALAEILFGDRNPEGRLPASFEHSWEESPVHDSYYPAPHAAGTMPRVSYAEGLFVGYRYYTSRGRHPQFPFGFGLTYTHFSFSHLAIQPAVDTVWPIQVSFDVRNDGDRAGAEVAQLYVGNPAAKVARPARELKGFRKVRLEPGQTERVTMTLGRRAFAYFDVAAHQWRIDPGLFLFYVGDASDHTPLAADFNYVSPSGAAGDRFGP